MNIIQIYKKFPTQQDCLNHLEIVKWNNKPTCPYCNSKKQTPLKKENRYHCNTCNTSYSVLVGTIFENTKLDLQKWFLAISLVLNAKKGISARQLAKDIEVNKNTACYILMRLRGAMIEQYELLHGIIEVDETYSGGKGKNKHKSKKQYSTQGRNTIDKTPVAKGIERTRNIKARKTKDIKGKILKKIIRENVQKESTVITDEWRSYIGLSQNFDHLIIKHNTGEYIIENSHTNTIENFWSLLKRSIMGQYHHITDKYLDKYINEFCFKHDNRINKDIFKLTLQKALVL